MDYGVVGYVHDYLQRGSYLTLRFKNNLSEARKSQGKKRGFAGDGATRARVRGNARFNLREGLAVTPRSSDAQCQKYCLHFSKMKLLIK